MSDIPTSELARLLGITPSAISRQVARGALHPKMKLPGLRGPYIFDGQYVAELLEERKAS